MRIFSAVACVLLLAACSSGGYESARDVAAAFECVSVESDEVIGATESVSCELGDGSLRVSWFEDDSAFSAFRSLADAAAETGLASEIVYGDDWAVECDTDELCDLVRDRL